MGFDLHGMNPVIRKGKDPKTPKNLWKLPEEKRQKYFEKKWAFEDNNPGIYFRNNCWWWRSLWDYTYNECNDILTEKDWEFTSLRLPKNLLKDLRVDAKKNMRPIGLHIAFIIDRHLEYNKKLNKGGK